MDDGVQCLSEHSFHEIRHWGLTPSFASVEQPQTNRVAEGIIRTLYGQALHGLS